jgi:hypothetical protein
MDKKLKYLIEQWLTSNPFKAIYYHFVLWYKKVDISQAVADYYKEEYAVKEEIKAHGFGFDPYMCNPPGIRYNERGELEENPYDPRLRKGEFISGGIISHNEKVLIVDEEEEKKEINKLTDKIIRYVGDGEDERIFPQDAYVDNDKE